MKIKRRVLEEIIVEDKNKESELIQKEFVSRSQLNDNKDLSSFDISNRIGIEIIKTVEMIESLSKTNSMHWINEKLWKNIFSLIYDNSIKGNKLKYMYAFVYYEKDRTKLSRKDKTFGAIIDKSRILSPEVFIKTLEDQVLTESKASLNGQAKYSYIFDKRSVDNKFKHSIEEYLHLFKYIMLSLSGQIDPKIIDIFDPVVYKNTVNYGSEYLFKLPKDKANKEFSQRIATCIYNFCDGDNIDFGSRKERSDNQFLQLVNGNIR